MRLHVYESISSQLVRRALLLHSAPQLASRNGFLATSIPTRPRVEQKPASEILEQWPVLNAIHYFRTLSAAEQQLSHTWSVASVPLCSLDPHCLQRIRVSGNQSCSLHGSEASYPLSKHDEGASSWFVCNYPPTPADGKGERVRADRLWTTRNTTTVLRKLSKVAEQQQQQGATAASINSIGEVLGDARCFACVRQSKFSSSSSSSSKSTAAASPAAAAAVRAAAAASSQLGAASRS